MQSIVTGKCFPLQCLNYGGDQLATVHDQLATQTKEYR